MCKSGHPPDICTSLFSLLVSELNHIRVTSRIEAMMGALKKQYPRLFC